MKTGIEHLTEKEIDKGDTGSLIQWLNQAMERLHKLLDVEEYYERCMCWACKTKHNTNGIREFLKKAVATIKRRSQLQPVV